MNSEPKNPKVLSQKELVDLASDPSDLFCCSPVHPFEEGKGGGERAQINSPDNIRESDLDGVNPMSTTPK